MFAVIGSITFLLVIGYFSARYWRKRIYDRPTPIEISVEGLLRYDPPTTLDMGKEGLRDKSATVIKPFKEDPESRLFIGWVRVHGELWRAVSKKEEAANIEVGDEVVITARRGVTLEVSLAKHSAPGDCP